MELKLASVHLDHVVALTTILADPKDLVLVQVARANAQCTGSVSWCLPRLTIKKRTGTYITGIFAKTVHPLYQSVPILPLSTTTSDVEPVIDTSVQYPQAPQHEAELLSVCLMVRGRV